MDTKEFMTDVVPWVEGDYVAIWWTHPRWGKWKFTSCQSIDHFFKIISQLDAVNTYFCISSQSEGKGKRVIANARFFRCLPVDIDFKTHYSTPEEAITEVLKFCDAVKIPKPSIAVMSGGGLHLYWLSDRDIPADDWHVFAIAFKVAAQEFGLKFDAKCTGNKAQLMRIPGSLNVKYDPPRLVHIVAGNGTKYDFKEIFGHLLDRLDSINLPRQPIEMADKFKHLNPDDTMAGGIKGVAPVPFAPIREGCSWLRTAHETGGRNNDQTEWNLMMLAATFIENGDQLAHELGGQHPTYSHADTVNKYNIKLGERASNPKLGWPSCKEVYQNGGRSHCMECPHLALGKSPLNLGLAVAKVETVDRMMVALGGRRPPELRLPEGFCVNDKDQICALIVPAKTKQSPRLLVLITNRIHSPRLQIHDKQKGISFIATRGRNDEVELFIPAGSTYKDSGLLKLCADNNVRYDPAPEAKVMLERFVKSWLDKLQVEDQPTERDPGMGWKYTNGQRSGFVYGSTLYNIDGTTVPLVQSVADADFRSYYMPTGSIDVERAAFKLLTDRKRPELNVILAGAFAGPLMVFTGANYGTMLSTFGDPGTGKSTGQQAAASVWGHPKFTRESLTSTPKSVLKRLGNTKNLPAYWDDVQDERQQERLFDLAFVLTEGVEGSRLNPDATMKERLDWQSMIVVCGNASFIDFLTKKQKSTTAGMRRVFEIEFKQQDDPGMVDPINASLAFGQLERNFGNLGAAYAQILARDHDAIAQGVIEVTSYFRKRVKGTVEESHWWNLCGVLLSGALLVRRLGIDLDYEAMEKFLIAAFERNRQVRVDEATEGGTRTNTENALIAFLNMHRNAGNVIYTDYKFEHRNIPVLVLSNHTLQRPIYIQIVRDQRLILISKRVFKEWMEDREIRHRMVFQGMADHFGAKQPKLTLGAGTDYAQAQELVIEFVVPPGPGIFNEMMAAYGEPKIAPHLVPGTARDGDGT